MKPVTFFVPGIPAPGGSKRGFVTKHGKIAMVDAAGQRNKDWRATVALVASQHISAPLDGPLRVWFQFRLPKPKSVRREYPTTRPDVLKLARSTEDALTGIAWLDDAQIVDEIITKRYGKPGCWIDIESEWGRNE